MRVAFSRASSWLPGCSKVPQGAPSCPKVPQGAPRSESTRHMFSSGTEQWAFVVQVAPAGAIVEGSCNASDPGYAISAISHKWWISLQPGSKSSGGSLELVGCQHIFGHTVWHYLAASVPEKHLTCSVTNRLQTELLFICHWIVMPHVS